MLFNIKWYLISLILRSVVKSSKHFRVHKIFPKVFFEREFHRRTFCSEEVQPRARLVLSTFWPWGLFSVKTFHSEQLTPKDFLSNGFGGASTVRKHALRKFQSNANLRNSINNFHVFLLFAGLHWSVWVWIYRFIHFYVRYIPEHSQFVMLYYKLKRYQKPMHAVNVFTSQQPIVKWLCSCIVK